MGAEVWSYFVPHEEDIGGALLKLRKREFEAGRYYPVQHERVTRARQH